MAIWLQNLLVLLAVIACVAFTARSAILALHGSKSRLGGCGTCSGCATTPAANGASDSKPKNERIAIIPADMLIKRRVPGKTK
ncbi:MAG TPA: FeoB-associated Cys-rich membrane protein [Tepidisphaeraceae bacterium]|nr:FeoB-associated Cys-rich membrane protein [Tepidisphaeraceae bacterium]